MGRLTRQNNRKRRRNQTKPCGAEERKVATGEMKILTEEEAHPRLEYRPFTMFNIYCP